MWCRFAVRQIEDADSKTFALELDDRSPHPQFGIIRMRGHDQNIQLHTSPQPIPGRRRMEKRQMLWT